MSIVWSKQDKIFKSELSNDPHIDYFIKIKSTYLSPKAKKDIIQFKFNRDSDKERLICLNLNENTKFNTYKILCQRCWKQLLISTCMRCKIYHIHWSK